MGTAGGMDSEKLGELSASIKCAFYYYYLSVVTDRQTSQLADNCSALVILVLFVVAFALYLISEKRATVAVPSLSSSRCS